MGTYGKWDEKHLQMAVTAYKNSDYGLNECARVYGVPKATVKRHAYSKNTFSNAVKSFRRQATFTGEIEKVLAEHILLFEEMFIGYSIKNIHIWTFKGSLWKSSIVGTAECAFRAAGIWSVDRNVFSDHHFVPSETLEVDENVADEPTSSKGLKRTYERYSEGDTSGRPFCNDVNHLFVYLVFFVY
ncbi:hypothetical protein J437_LFUL017276 [Ladona fulva]|uniref:HTH psq-type domain-containing protein n=1 Tax=Ladona fulva TaxID=123851 RepID=A0A8K0NXD2_LADFU|nr:hypothetical protein J437_LFUL017276 [Ladona fulva]